MQSQNVFVNYTHPSQQRDRQQRQRIASYIGTYYRNRSRPTARREAELGESTNESSFSNQLEVQSTTEPLRVLRWRLQSQITSPLRGHDMHGFKVDPFDSYPIPGSDRVPRALDYCTLVVSHCFVIAHLPKSFKLMAPHT